MGGCGFAFAPCGKAAPYRGVIPVLLFRGFASTNGGIASKQFQEV